MADLNLTLHLKEIWYKKTKIGDKTEDYRELNQYWCKRLFGEYVYYDDGGKAPDEMVYAYFKEAIKQKRIIIPKPFTHNIMKWGYPPKGDTERTLIYEHAGIEIGKGNPDWGAVEGRYYFIIKHGKRVQ